MCVCVCVYMCVCVYICVYVYIYVCVCIYIYIYITESLCYTPETNIKPNILHFFQKFLFYIHTHTMNLYMHKQPSRGAQNQGHLLHLSTTLTSVLNEMKS